MTKQGKRYSWDPYTSDVARLSIYPSIKMPEEERLEPGRILVVEIKDVDSKGNGIVKYKDKRIVVYNASLGSKVKIKITRVNKDTAFAEIIDILSDADNRY
ncbi:MAG: TRAM domain-containing protein [Desulfurococcaceae archaeon]